MDSYNLVNGDHLTAERASEQRNRQEGVGLRRHHHVRLGRHARRRGRCQRRPGPGDALGNFMNARPCCRRSKTARSRWRPSTTRCAAFCVWRFVSAGWTASRRTEHSALQSGGAQVALEAARESAGAAEERRPRAAARYGRGQDHRRDRPQRLSGRAQRGRQRGREAVRRGELLEALTDKLGAKATVLWNAALPERKQLAAETEFSTEAAAARRA